MKRAYEYVSSFVRPNLEKFVTYIWMEDPVAGPDWTGIYLGGGKFATTAPSRYWDIRRFPDERILRQAGVEYSDFMRTEFLAAVNGTLQNLPQPTRTGTFDTYIRRHSSDPDFTQFMFQRPTIGEPGPSIALQYGYGRKRRVSRKKTSRRKRSSY